METNYVSCNNSNPVAYITIGKGRVKINQSNQVYLKDKQNFEIELFNPTKEKVMAKITLNGYNISSRGIVLRPGERIFLDRHLDTPDKFQFSTYKVEDNNSIVDKAIKNNGAVQIDFYKEKINNNLYNATINITPNTYYPTYYPTYLTGTQTTGGIYYLTTTQTTGGIQYLTATTTCGANVSKSFKETGTIEKGEKSEQKFDEVNYNFEYYSFLTIFYKILPISEKPININELNNEKRYCPSCGKKVIKKGYKYCPSCGYKIY